MTTTDDLVADYLERVRRAGAGLPPERREELITDLRDHLLVARAELAPETEAGVRTLLDRLGDPAAIVAEATAATAATVATVAPVAPAPRRSNRTLVIVLSVLAALVLLPVLVCLVGAAWFFPARVEIDQGPVVEVSTQPAVESSG
jgi:uncharacterized membrane protein